MEKKPIITEKLKNILINSSTSFHNFEIENVNSSQNIEEMSN